MGLHRVLLLLKFLFAVLKIIDSKIFLIVWSMSSISGMSMTFLSFFFLDDTEKFIKKYLSFKHCSINFSLKKENDGRLSFVDINIFCEKGKLVSNVYQATVSEDLLPYLINLLLQICTRINHLMKNKLPYCKFEMTSKVSPSW